MINAAHVILYSNDADADRAFFRDVLQYESADAGHGWLIFALPPAEVAVHPTEDAPQHELYFMCDDIEATITELRAKGVEFENDAATHEERWGVIASLKLPGGGTVGVYEPRHASPLAV